MLRRSRLVTWLVVYELVYIVTSIAVSLMLFYSSRASPLESIAFIRGRGVLDAVLRIWLSNTASFLVVASLVVLHPVLGVFAVAFSSVFSGELLASWLSGYCGVAHLTYGVFEDQAFIVLWLAAARTYYVQKMCSDLMCRWFSTLRQVGRLLVYAFTIFLILAAIEVVEVRTFG